MRSPSLFALLFLSLAITPLLIAPHASAAAVVVDGDGGGESGGDGVEGKGGGDGNGDGDAVTFMLYDNGSSNGGVEVTLTEFSTGDDPSSPLGEAFAVAMSSRIEVSKHLAPKPVLATRAYREDGELVVSLEQLRPVETNGSTDGDGSGGDGGGDGSGGDDAPPPPRRHRRQLRRVYLVAEDLDFVWPFVRLGHRQTVSTNVVPSNEAGPVVLESFSATPRVFRVYNMATVAEAEGIIATALAKKGDDAIKRSTVGSGKDEEGNDVAKEDFGRTSENAWDSESPEAKVMIERSFQLTNIEDDGGKRDGLQVVRYFPGQGYNTHPDYFQARDDDDFDFHPYSGGSNRFATVFMYLNEPEEGGNTVFPKAPGLDPNARAPQHALDMFDVGSWERLVTEQCYTKLSVPPKQGTAALFYSSTPDGRIDHNSLHAACPLIKGTKWGANIWIWNKQRYGEIRTGEPRKVEIVNNSGETVYISWERKDNGSVMPGTTYRLNSFEFHRFQASFGSHKEKATAVFTVASKPEQQVWVIERPRKHAVAEADETTAAIEALRRKVHVAVSPESTGPICVTWKGSKVSVVTPGEQSTMGSFVGHEFEASFGASCDGPILDRYTVPEDTGELVWRIPPGEVLEADAIPPSPEEPYDASVRKKAEAESVASDVILGRAKNMLYGAQDARTTGDEL